MLLDELKDAVKEFARGHADVDGLAITPVPCLRMMYVEQPRDSLHSIYRPLVCMILQGAKQMVVGTQEAVFSAGQSVIVSADMPVTGKVVEATPSKPYMAIAVEFDMALLREVALHMAGAEDPLNDEVRTLFARDTQASALECASRLLRLVDSPASIPLLSSGIMKELLFWLLSGPHADIVRTLALPDNNASRVGRAIAKLRADYRKPLSLQLLAGEAAMELTAFHKHFKRLTSLTPRKFQQRLRLIEARRMMISHGTSASRASFEVGYSSLSQFSREYTRLFGKPPRRDVAQVLFQGMPPSTLVSGYET